MEGKRLIEKIKLRNILSFGERELEFKPKSQVERFWGNLDHKGEEVELLPLNIIIGQNGSGKSNLVDVIKLLNSLPKDKGLVSHISKSGGIGEWLWKGEKKGYFAEIDVEISIASKNVFYTIHFAEYNGRLKVAIEKIYDDPNTSKVSDREDNMSSEESILAPDQYKKFKNVVPSSYSIVRYNFLEFKIYDDFQTGRGSEIRKLQFADLPNNFLDENAENLSLVLNDLEYRGKIKDKVIEYLKRFNPKINNYSTRVIGGTVQLNLFEEGLEKPISAMRLSDGTLRYLCLLAILCHPEPPPLICIEEPETGLHPDILPTIAELMKEASQRTQLIVTTHSDILVSAFSDMPEAVLVCEKDEDGTHFKRLNEEELKVWLEEYTLGEVWLRGGIGGTRW